MDYKKFQLPLQKKKMVRKNLAEKTQKIFNTHFSTDLSADNFLFTHTKSEFEGDYTLVVYPLLKFAQQQPQDLASLLGEKLQTKCSNIKNFNIVKGFLNIILTDEFWINYILEFDDENLINLSENPKNYVIEFSSPNTNKPLHLGHIRNNLLGDSVSNLLEYAGHKVTRVSLLNDRGIHICKSLYAWETWGNKITPETANKKGDHLIGDFYVLFNKKYQEEIKDLKLKGLTTEEAEQQSELLGKAKKILKKWERGRKDIIEKWKLLNSWVISGFDETYKKLGISFDKINYESITYLKGKDIVMKELSKGTVDIDDSGATVINLSDVGLDTKVLLRSDGTSVYITQDIGTAVSRYDEFSFDSHIYIVGNEQIYHFKVLKEVLKKFDFPWYEKISHYSYGMVELPEGKMKSREGTVVDADDLIQELYDTAKHKALELGKLKNTSPANLEDISHKIAMGALKYFILKVDPKKNMLFNTTESIDFNGNTGPFIQYTCTRINSLLNKANPENYLFPIKEVSLSTKEKELIKKIYAFISTLNEAVKNVNPALIANYAYNLAKHYNSFYQELPILNANTHAHKIFRLKLSLCVIKTISTSLKILGIQIPKQM